VLKRVLENVRATRSRKTPRIPVVLSVNEVKKILSKLQEKNNIVYQVNYLYFIPKKIEIHCFLQAFNFNIVM
jgi:hypothetical protein